MHLPLVSPHNQLNNAAALSFFFLLFLSPLLIFLVSLMALLPVHNLDNQILETVSQLSDGCYESSGPSTKVRF